MKIPHVYQRGVPIPEFIGQPDGVRFHLDGTGAVILACYDRPYQDEIAAWSSGSELRLAVCHFSGLLFVLLRPGKLAWMDAPYNPFLPGALPPKLEVPDGSGLGIMVVLVDTSTGAPAVLRYVGASTGFTRELYAAIHAVHAAGEDAEAYDLRIMQATERHETDALLRMAGREYRLREGKG